MNDKDMIGEFQGEYRWLSNFIGGVEQKYQAAKCCLEDDAALILNLTPADAKRAGKRVTVRPDWESVKIPVMLTLLREKFFQEPYRSKLLATEDRLIREGNRWGDKFWGFDLRTNIGMNYLGRLIMKVRAELRQLSNVEHIYEVDRHYLQENLK